MKDLVSAGTGNSRLLKSSVPAGTTWEQALAMLTAGTFPIDFAGINAAGITQLGTPLNKANLLSDATASAIFGNSNDHSVSEALSRLKTDGLKIATGSYVGTGTYGEANPCSLTFDFVPWLVYVYCSRSRSFSANNITYLYELSQYDYFLWIYNSKGRSIYSDYNENNTSWNGPSAQSTDGFFNLVGNTLGWFVQSTAASYQLNTSGFPYSYTVIGI